MAEPLDPGPFRDVWDEYAARFGPLPCHLQKADAAFIAALTALQHDALARDSAITADELAEAGYEAPHEGLFI